jgi:hypothetical protein
MKKAIAILMLVILAVMLGAGCTLLNPPLTVNAGYYIDNKPESKTTVQLGTSNSQANAIHAGIGASAEATDGQPAEADKTGQKAKSSGLFVNNVVGDRQADIDATAALELLRDVKGASAGQTQTTSKGDSSPSTGTQSQTPALNENRTVNVPVAVSQQGAAAKTGDAPEAAAETGGEAAGK